MTRQKSIGLVRPDQIEAYENAKKAAIRKLGDVSEGEIVKEGSIKILQS